MAADWTRLPRQESQGERITRRTAERVEKLTLAGDYGVLVPFLGEELMVGTDLLLRPDDPGGENRGGPGV